jgi:hypothetical protein
MSGALDRPQGLYALAPAAQPMGQQDMLARLLRGNPDPSLPGYPVMQSSEGRGFKPIPFQGEGFQRMAAVLRGDVEPTPGEQMGMNVVRGFTEGPATIRAFHGSPHRFDRFDMSRIGTGEGAQAYGHGLYFAGNEGVAQSYKQSVMRNPDELVNIAKNYGLQGDAAEMLAHQTSTGFGGQRFDAWLDGLRASIDDPLLSPRTKSAIQQILDKTPESADAYALMKAPGNMYEVNLNTTPDRLLDWDAPLSRQPQAVREGIENVLPTQSWGLPREMTGAEAWRRATEQDLGAWNNRSEMAAQSFRELGGIPGIQYLDAGSRAAGDGTRNYVMFDDKLIDILRRYGIAGTLGGGAAATSGTSE